jgi:hypothetical protein
MIQKSRTESEHLKERARERAGKEQLKKDPNRQVSTENSKKRVMSKVAFARQCLSSATKSLDTKED